MEIFLSNKIKFLYIGLLVTILSLLYAARIKSLPSAELKNYHSMSINPYWAPSMRMRNWVFHFLRHWDGKKCTRK